ncbi:hypothetical protein MPOCJGCO_1752 [Methylobacterium trifolii]|uniref:DUF2924 domain-containing protein n=2 Tax=Methylobacterium trifolii TaxID=1003092 RepID=A0ABQ4TWL7_9HYPH|nr:hypothetical protein MPOCJGCO_1752 [Methylobacterium trifolii]
MGARLKPPARSVPLGIALERLAGMDQAGLRRRWRSCFGRPAPEGLSPALLYRALAYRFQAEALGDLDRSTVQTMARLAADLDGAAVPPLPELAAIKPGTLLVREWEGVLHIVTVLEAGFAWQGRHYDSLSALARSITGTAWNGPRFFGLRKASSDGKQRVATATAVDSEGARP